MNFVSLVWRHCWSYPSEAVYQSFDKSGDQQATVSRICSGWRCSTYVYSAKVLRTVVNSEEDRPLDKLCEEGERLSTTCSCCLAGEFEGPGRRTTNRLGPQEVKLLTFSHFGHVARGLVRSCLFNQLPLGPGSGGQLSPKDFKRVIRDLGEDVETVDFGSFMKMRLGTDCDTFMPHSVTNTVRGAEGL